MGKKHFIILFTIAFLLLCSLEGADKNESIKEEVVVIGSLIPVEFSKIARRVTIIEEEEISKVGANSVSDLLKHILGLDLRQRAPFGVQADLSIRGSNFSQISILINGIKVYDPQTAHHNLEIPVSLSSIERIEVLHGQGSSLYGENAIGGVVNIVTKKSFQKKVSGQFSAGSYKTLFGSFSLSRSFKRISQAFTVEYQKSDGFAFNRDFEVFNLSSISHIKFLHNWLGLLIGFNKKEFGADNFYGPFPSKEWTETKFMGVEWKIRSTKIKFLYRRHDDKFLLDINQPDWHVNTHKSQSYGAEVHSFLEWGSAGKLFIGGEARKDGIQSKLLGNRSYWKLSVFSEFQTILNGKLYVNVDARGDYFSNHGMEFVPGFSLSYLFSSRLKIRASAGKAFRIPSFTELYYYSPANRGNAELKPEKSLSFEAGIDYFPLHDFQLEATAFLRKDKDIIDWIKRENQLFWEAENIQKIDFYGIETNLKFKNTFLAGYSYMKSNPDMLVNLLSKYVLNHPVHQICSTLHLSLPFDINYGCWVSFKKRKKQKGYLIVDIRISRMIKNWEFYIQATNVSNVRYYEIPSVSMPGRWIMAGIKFSVR